MAIFLSKSVYVRFLAVFTIALCCVSVQAADPVYTRLFSNKALEGYDAVSYFKSGKPVKGAKEHKLEYNGAVWLFSSAENLLEFKSSPESFEPQYGGYCAWAVSEKNDFAPGDPEHWSIIDNKLYLNYNAKVKRDWISDSSGFIEKADRNWPDLIN